MKLIGDSRKREHAAPRNKGRSATAVKRGRARSKGGKLITVLCSLLLIIAALAAAYFIWEKPPERQSQGLVTPTPTAAPVGEVAPPSPTPESVNEHNDDKYTFLIVGKDKVGANTDTILVGAIDTGEHKMDVVSIPRDTLVNTPHSVKKINTLYGYDLNDGGDGVTGLKDGVRDLLGFDVDCYAVVDIAAFEKLVDTMGGVYYDVPIDMYYDDPYQDLHIAIPKGYQLLDGENALHVVRFRMGDNGTGYPTGDIGRIATQQEFLKSVASQFIKAGSIPNLTAVANIFTEYVKTDLTAANISFFAREFLLCKTEDVNFHTLPGNYEDSIGGFSYVSLYLDEWLELVNNCLNPWHDRVTEVNVNILTHENGVIRSTSGEVEGGENSFLTMSEYLASLSSGE